MGTIQFTERGVAAHARHETRILAQAAVAALPAPSIFNSQPWRWRISSLGAELHADRARQLHSADPDGRMLTVSCGIALHHALVSLAAAGAEVKVERFPEPENPDFFARVVVTGQGRPDPSAVRLAAAMTTRRTDRRPFADQAVPEESLTSLCGAAQGCGAHLHLLRSAEVVSLTSATSRARAIESEDPGYQSEVAAWTHRDVEEGDGLVSRPDPGARLVPLRDFTGDEETGAFPPPLLSISDRMARYAILFTDGDDPTDWLAAGEGLSCVLLTAATKGLSASPMSETVEVPVTRILLRKILGEVGHPVLTIRFGLAARSEEETPATPRRPADDIIEFVEEATVVKEEEETAEPTAGDPRP